MTIKYQVNTHIYVSTVQGTSRNGRFRPLRSRILIERKKRWRQWGANRRLASAKSSICSTQEETNPSAACMYCYSAEELLQRDSASRRIIRREISALISVTHRVYSMGRGQAMTSSSGESCRGRDDPRRGNAFSPV